MCSSTAESAPKDETMAMSSASSSVAAWRRTDTPSISSNMPLSDMMPSALSLSGFRSECSWIWELDIPIKRLLERLLAEPAEGGDKGFVGGLAAGDIGIDQPLDGVGHVFGHEAVTQN